MQNTAALLNAAEKLCHELRVNWKPEQNGALAWQGRPFVQHKRSFLSWMEMKKPFATQMRRELRSFGAAGGLQFILNRDIIYLMWKSAEGSFTLYKSKEAASLQPRK